MTLKRVIMVAARYLFTSSFWDHMTSLRAKLYYIAKNLQEQRAKA